MRALVVKSFVIPPPVPSLLSGTGNPQSTYMVSLFYVPVVRHNLKFNQDWVWWYKSVIPATWEAEIGRLWFEASPGKS
jgi:hypothetical protein